MSIVIIGAGAAGSAMAQELSRLGHGAVIVDSRPEPVELPPLSKDLGSWRPQPHRLDLPGITRITDTVTRIGPGRIAFAERSALKADAVVLATGLRPRPAPNGALTIGNSPDAQRVRAEIAALRERQQAGEDVSVGVIGSGFLAMELARGARDLGLDVHAYLREDLPLPGLSTPMRSAVAALHGGAGIVFHPGEPEPDAGERDLWLGAVGAVPNLPAIDHPVECDETGRIRVDADMRAADGLWVIGDAASVSPDMVRQAGQGTEASAMMQGRRLAARLTAAPAGTVVGADATEDDGTGRPELPWQWSFQGPVRVFAVGALLQDCDPEPIVLGDLFAGRGHVLSFHPDRGRLARVETLGNPAGHNAAKKILASPQTAPVREESDSLDLRAWALENS